MKEYPDSRLRLLEQILGLSASESDLLQACLALSVEPNLGKVYAYLNDHSGRGFVTEEMSARLFGHSRSLLLGGAGSALKAWNMIREKDTGRGEPALFECDPHMRNWLLGGNDIDESLALIARFQTSYEPLESWDTVSVLHFIQKMSALENQQCLRIFVSGPPGSGRRTLAAWVAQQFGMPLLTLDCNRIAPERWQQVFTHAQRQAFLDGCALAWIGDTVLEKDWNLPVPCFYLQFFICEPGQFTPLVPGMADYRVEMPILPSDERRQLWRRFVPGSASWNAADFEHLLLRYQATIGQIVAVGEKGAESAIEAANLLRASTRHHLGSLAQLMECPFTWDDLIVPDWLRRNLEDFVFEASERTAVWEKQEVKRLFSQGRGLLALFSGSPGTGKTMAAQVIAAELGLDLFRIDMSTVISKYVGETSKNMERILSRAHRMNAVLLFDEADALFGKRTDVNDAHDRYANTDTNYLLQAIESYPGVALLASNKKANMDTGFIRRLRYVLEFPKPDAAQRLQLWQKIVGELTGKETLTTLNGKLPRLAEAVELTGAQIKFSVLSAVFAARRERTALAMPHLLSGLERELMKEGKGISRQAQEMLK